MGKSTAYAPARKTRTVVFTLRAAKLPKFVPGGLAGPGTKRARFTARRVPGLTAPAPATGRVRYKVCSATLIGKLTSPSRAVPFSVQSKKNRQDLQE